ncbi:MAG TPA: GAF domain-containing protein, partial [Burkholderiales bacterium]
MRRTPSGKTERRKGSSEPKPGDLRRQLAQIKRALRQVRERYEIAMSAMNESAYDWDITNGRFLVSRSMQQTLGLPSELRSIEAWQKRIHPDDYHRFREATLAHLKGVTERLHCDYRYRAAGGAWRWARTHGTALRDKNGRALRMIGSTSDITELKRAEAALQVSEERYALATSVAVEGIYEWDLEAGRFYLTERAKAFFSLSGEDLTPAAWNSRIHGDDYPGYRRAIVEYFKGRSPRFEHEYRIAEGHAGYKWVLDRGIGVRDSAGRVTRLVGALSDIDERKNADLELRRARDEAEEALEQQTAISDILRVISSSPSDLQPVFDTILSHAISLCEGSRAVLWQYDGKHLRVAAHKHGNPEGIAYLKDHPLELVAHNATPQAALERRTVHVVNAFAEPGYRPLIPPGAVPDSLPTPAVLAVPLLLDDAVLGVISIWRHEARAFTDQQIAMVNTFAAQAVIAIENVRLFNQTKEALERQTATAEILRVIASSPTDVQPVLNAIAERAAILCGAPNANVLLRDGDVLRTLAGFYRDVGGEAPDRTSTVPLRRGAVNGRALLDRKVVHHADALPLLDTEYPESRDLVRRFGIRSHLVVPLVRKGEALGTISIWRREVRPFSIDEIALVQTFADQAVIAIENVRLFKELRERTEALTKSVDQLTALGEVGQAISSTLDLDTVLKTIVQRAVQLTGLDAGAIYEYDAPSEQFHLRAAENIDEEVLAVYRSTPIRKG